MIFFLSIVLIAASFIATYGWGRMIARFTYGTNNQPWAYLSALGLAFLIFVGGVINCIGIAYPYVFHTIFIAGMVFGIVDSVRKSSLPSFKIMDLNSKRFFDKVCYAFSILLILTACLFWIATLLPTKAFNIYDDFQTYLVRPIQMLQTGTIGGNHFDILGIDSLGGQSFLQAFILSVFPIEYIHGFDMIFCFLLMASLLSGISQRLQAHGVYLLLAIAALILINPQTINIATLYSGSVMIVGMIFSSMILPDSSPPKEIKSLLMKSIPVAIFISALIALKTTLIVFAVLFFFLYFLILLIFINDKKLVIITTIMIAALVLLLLLPWIAIYRDNYWGIIQNILYTNQPDLFSGSNYSSRSLITKSWFSSNRLYWGGSFLGYNILMLIMLMFSLLAAYASTKKKTVLPKPYLLAVLIACVVTIANYFITAFFWDPDTQIRYSCPVLIAILPLAILILGKQYDIPKSDVSVVACKGIFDRFRIPSVMLLILIIMVVFFGPALLERMSLVYHRRTVLAFPLPMGYIGFNTTMFTEAARNDIRNVQNKTEENQKILAWVSVPFHLDFSRNKIFTVSEPGICNPWLRFPLNGSTEDIRKFIKDMGIRYVIWEYKGAALKKESEFNSYLRSPFLIYRKIAVYNLYFRKMLKALAEENRVIYNQNGIVIIDIQ